MPTATAKSSGPPPVSPGIYHAVCYAVIDLGTQPSQMYAPKRKVMLIWELPHERFDYTDEKNATVNRARVISSEYTLSIGKKATLRTVLESWRGKPFSQEEAQAFEVGVLAGKNCQLNVVYKPSKDGSRIYANVGSVVPLGKGMTPVKPENPILVFDIPAQGKISFPKELPKWIVNKIKGSEEYQASIGVNTHAKKNGLSPEQAANLPLGDEADEDVPF